MFLIHIKKEDIGEITLDLIDMVLEQSNVFCLISLCADGLYTRRFRSDVIACGKIIKAS